MSRRKRGGTKGRAERQRCAIMRQYRNGRTRLTCRRHDWSTAWIDNTEAVLARTAHERAVTGKEEA